MMMGRVRRFLVMAGIGMFMVGCNTDVPDSQVPLPQEPAATTVGNICNMVLSEHPGPKGQMFVAGEANGPLWFSSVRDAFAYLLLEGSTRRILAFYVHDMSRANWERPEAGMWMRAGDAFFVVGSQRVGGMGVPEIVPFSQVAAAEQFATRYGGKVRRFSEIGEREVMPQ